MTDIVERLLGETKQAVRRLIKGAWRRDGERLSQNDCPRFGIPARPDYDDDLTVPRDLTEAADTIAILRAEIEQLREALEPFANAADGFDSYNIKNPEERFAYSDVNMHGKRTGSITVSDLRRARATRAAITTQEKQNGRD